MTNKKLRKDKKDSVGDIRGIFFDSVSIKTEKNIRLRVQVKGKHSFCDKRLKLVN